MLSRLVVAIYAWLLEALLWLALVVSAAAGYMLTVPWLIQAGAAPESTLAWRLAGAGVFVALTFVGLALVVGPILTLLDLRRAVRRMEASMTMNDNRAPPRTGDRDEPRL